MANKYLNFISDDHLINCICNLHLAYLRAQNDITKKKFYSNKIDTIKLTFDSLFNHIEEEKILQAEVLRQIDKSINNSIGTFHEQILGGVEGFVNSYLSGYDIKAIDDTLFADLKNKYNTMNSGSAESLFQKLIRFADTYNQAKCYCVQILAKTSFCELWEAEINGIEYRHNRVYKISGDKFYALVTGQEDALFQLYKALPIAINDYLNLAQINKQVIMSSAIEEITTQSDISNRTVLDQITFDNFNYYLGFDKL